MNDNTDLKKLAEALMSASKAITAIYEIAEKVEDKPDKPDEIPFENEPFIKIADNILALKQKDGYDIVVESSHTDGKTAYANGKYIRK